MNSKLYTATFQKKYAFKLFAHLIIILLRYPLILNQWDANKTLRLRALNVKLNSSISGQGWAEVKTT